MKSHASDLVRLAECLLLDASAKCAAEFDHRDLDTLRTRVEHEGMSFLTITLPSFGKDFERSLASGRIDPTCFRSFKKRGAIPAFLQGMLGRLFDLNSGRILDYEESHSELVEGIRQICHAFRKIEIACTSERQRAAVHEFIETELDLQRFEEELRVQDDRFNSVNRMLWSSVIPGDILVTLLPKHGPGATAERLQGNAKYRSPRWHERLEWFMPFTGNLLHVSSVGEQPWANVTLVPPNEEQPVRVTLVPKTLKGPRVIAIEPVCMQYTQQALARELVNALERSPYTGGHVNFTDQSINRELAITSSQTGQYCTIDLSSASDRVPRKLALSMFDWHPELRDAIDACRSTKAELPNGSIIPLSKFASMGSALCFPIEAMYFYTICVVALLELQNLPVTPANLLRVGKDVYVYGDDIIVPTYAAASVIETLQKYNCKVNADKSFFAGNFRESCGMDAYNGTEVTPTYIRHLRPNHRTDFAPLISYVSTANALYQKGYWRTTTLLRGWVEQHLGSLPFVEETSAALGWVSYSQPCTVERVQIEPKDRKTPWTQSPQVRGWVAEPVYREDRLEGYPALTKCLLALEARYTTQPSSVDEKHLERTARHGAVTLKRRWVSPF